MNPKQWLCKNGHALGVIQWNGNKIPQLALYRHAVDMGADDPEAVDVIGPLMGKMPVRCDVDGCGAVRFWDISVDAVAGFMASLNAKQWEQLEVRLRRGKVRKRTIYKNRAKVEK